MQIDYQSWLAKEGKYFSKETILVQAGMQKLKGKLDWDAMTSFTKDGMDFTVVPFVFERGTAKNVKLLSDEGTSMLYDLVLRKSKAGLIEARMRMRAFFNSASGKPKIYDSYYTLDGHYVFGGVWENKAFFILHDDAANNSPNQKTTAVCTEEVTVTSTFYCEGTTEQMFCYYIRRTKTKYRCDYDFNNEQEAISWIAPDEGGGGYEYEETTEEYENKNIIDSLQGYPCAQAILKQMPSLGEEVTNLIYNVFGKSKTINLIYKGDTTLSYLEDGKLSAQGSNYGMGRGNFRILINDAILRNASQEYILATLIHEALHAFVYYERFNMGDSLFNLTYPIFGQYKNNDPQHNLMAERFRLSMEDALKKFNPNLDAGTASALTWAGLDKTDLWKTLPDTINTRQSYWAERNVLDTTSYGHYKGTKCLN